MFQLSTGLFPGEFFPELLGMTLFLEWESTPTLAPMVRMLAARHINPHFYRIHVAVDNTVGGHGALAKEAVKLYLKQKREEGGERLVQASWRRIWRGYVTWATIGGLGGELAERLFAIDHKTINVSATPGQRTLWPDLQRYHGQRMAALIQRKAPVAKQVHGGRAVAGAPLSELFGDPPRLMEALVEGGYVDVEHPRRSRFLELLAFENGPMYKVFTPAEREIIMDWMESLRPSPGEGADPIEEDTSEDLPARMAQVVATVRAPGTDGSRRDPPDRPRWPRGAALGGPVRPAPRASPGAVHERVGRSRRRGSKPVRHAHGLEWWSRWTASIDLPDT